MEQPATFEPATSEKTPFRLVCFTEYDMSRDMQALATKFQYLCYGKETCPTTGRQHFQGYAYAGKAQKWSYYKKAFGSTHFEKCQGSLESNDRYCKKEGSWIEFGLKPMGNGKKRSLLEVKEQLDAGVPFRKVQRMEEHFETCIRYSAGLREYQRSLRYDQALDRGYFRRTVEIYIGEADVGKTRYVMDKHGLSNVYRMPDKTMQWAGNYDGQSVVLFDDVGPGDIMSLTRFLEITDGYPIEVPVKGGFVSWHPTHIYFTSNFPWREWWKDLNAVQEPAVLRRISKVTYVFKDGPVVDYENVQAQVFSETSVQQQEA